jgi:hypothetical protein
MPCTYDRRYTNDNNIVTCAAGRRPWYEAQLAFESRRNLVTLNINNLGDLRYFIAIVSLRALELAGSFTGSV